MNSKTLVWTLITILSVTVVAMLTVSGCTDASMDASQNFSADATVDMFLKERAQVPISAIESSDVSEARVKTFSDSRWSASASGLADTSAEYHLLVPDEGRGRDMTGVPSSSRARSASPRTAPGRSFRHFNARQRAVNQAAVRNAPPGGLPALDEEVWVIIKPAPTTVAAVETATPGSGVMFCRLPDAGQIRNIELPLEHTDVSATIDAYIASVQVTQQFRNPYESKIEAVYVFPLPQNAAINGFVMTVGERQIRGIIRERLEAERIYKAAKQQGYVASLLTQERANVFTQKVANIEPGKQIDVEITYFHTLSYDDGWYEYTFPMVVAPRYNPAGTTLGVGAAPRGRRGASGQRTEVQYLAPNERSGHDISLAVSIRAGVSIEEIRCNSHEVEITNELSEQVEVCLSPSDSIPNKDFVLRYRVAGDEVKTGLLTHLGEDGRYFTYMIYPPQSIGDTERRPVEMIFVLDCSGSMQGAPMAQSRKAIDHALRQLRPDDTFQVIRFSNNASQFGAAPVPATPQNIASARQYVSQLRGNGGTQMIEGVKAALDFPHDPTRLRVVTFLTDGLIGNDAQILGAVHDRVDASRIFSFGVGSSPNRYLMNRMAKLGRGAVAYLGLKDDGGEVMDHFFDRISHPVLTDIAIDWGSMEVTEAIPARMPDLFVGRPVIVTGKFRNSQATTVRVTGRAGSEVVEARFEVDPVESSNAGNALPSIWARMRISELADRAIWDTSIQLGREVQTLALRYGLMSAFTSFVAVDSLTRTAGAYGTTVPVPVPVADGVVYRTTVSK